MTDVIFISTFEGGNLVYLSESAETLFGYPYETLVESPNLIYEVVHPDDRECFDESMRKHLTTGSVSMEYRIIRTDGSLRWVHAECHLNHSDVHPARLECIFRDITDIRRREDRIAKLNVLKGDLHREGALEEKLQRISDALIELFHVDHVYIWLRTHDPSDTALGDATDEPQLELYAGSFTGSDGSPDRSENVRFGINRILRFARGTDHRIVTNDVSRDPYADDIEWASQNGIRSFAGYHLLSTSNETLGVMALYSRSSISESADDLIQGVASTAGYLIQTATAENALKISERNYREIFNNTTDIMVVLDGREFIVRDANERIRDIYGIPPMQAIENLRTLLEVAPPPYNLCRLRELFHQAHETGSVRFDWPIQINNDRELWFEVNLCRAVIAGEQSLIASARDITARREMERELEEHRTRLEHLVDTRTAELQATVARLRTEIEHRRAAEREIREREELYRAITREANDGIVIMNTDGRIVFWNPAAERIFGYSADEARGEKILTLIASVEDYELYRNGIDRFMSVGKDAIDPGHFEATARRRDGSIFPIEFSLSAVEIWGGWHAVGIIRDTSERKRSERALRESEMRFRELQDNLPVGVFRTSPDGRLLTVNPAAVRLFGYDSMEEMLRLPFSELYDDPDERRTLLDALARDGRILNAELKARRKNGSTFDASLNVKTVCTKEGVINCYDGTVEDITTRNEMIELLRMNESRMKDIIHMIAGWIWEVDAGFAHTFVSAPTDTILGYQYSDILGKTPFDFMPENELNRFSEQIDDLRRGEKPLSNVQMNLLTKTGETVAVIVDGLPLFDDGGGFTGYRGITRYI